MLKHLRRVFPISPDKNCIFIKFSVFMALKDPLFMHEALKLAEEAYAAGEVPVGCVFVHNGCIIAKGRNNTNETKNGTSHAEIEAMAALFLGKNTHIPSLEIMTETDLYVTVEPCLMCASALGLMKIRKVYFGCSNDKFGGCGSVFSVHLGNNDHGKYEVEGGLLANEAIMMLRRFYVRENDHAPNPKKKHNRVLKNISKE
jgi:tRNA-specific adenosine deaminase 2